MAVLLWAMLRCGAHHLPSHIQRTCSSQNWWQLVPVPKALELVIRTPITTRSLDQDCAGPYRQVVSQQVD